MLFNLPYSRVYIWGQYSLGAEFAFADKAFLAQSRLLRTGWITVFPIMQVRSYPQQTRQQASPHILWSENL